eukprot:TRINITY_DN45343_c0_g1_i1.p1 TRINITY_DN45343_c0_g1~~TRINITY_DN45343_c0_g1_i1.p1  ORF type:complete len:434 (-),score=49.65 TRINITY_DN45343_c0_g1_i1:72-1373(-)
MSAEHVGNGDAVHDPLRVQGGVDTLPFLGQMKVAFQYFAGDTEGARATWERSTTYGLFASQARSAYEFSIGEKKAAWQRQCDFARGASIACQSLPDSMPVLGHVMAAVHCCRGDRHRGKRTARKATRSCAVLLAGAAVAPMASSAGVGCVSAKVAAGAAGLTAGLAAEALNARYKLPRSLSLSPGERFDYACLSLFDIWRGVAGLDIAWLLSPDYVTQVSMWSEPLNASDITHLVADWKPDWLKEVPSGAAHVFVKLTTAKGHVFTTERIHDGSVLINRLNGRLHEAFRDSQQVGTFASSRIHDSAILLGSTPVDHGPPVAGLEAFAQAESSLGYNLASANCQHYAADVYSRFLGGANAPALPNGDSLAMVGRILEPGQAPAAADVSLFRYFTWEAQQDPVSFVRDVAVGSWPSPVWCQHERLPKQVSSDVGA